MRGRKDGEAREDEIHRLMWYAKGGESQSEGETRLVPREA